MGSTIRHGRSIRRGLITVRTAIFLAIVSLPILWMGYIFIDEKLTGGIRQYPRYAEVDLKELGYFPIDAHDGTLADVPLRFRKLDGKRVLLIGFMYAGRSAANHVSSFEFVYNRTICCFGAFPLVQERVFVNVPNRDVPYSDPMVKIQGTLHVNVVKEAGLVQSVYTLDLERVDPL